MDAYTPPWTSVNPLSFVDAARSGAALGLQMTQLRNDAAAKAAQTAAEYANIGARKEEAAAQLQMARDNFQRMMMYDQGRLGIGQQRVDLYGNRIGQQGDLEQQRIDAASALHNGPRPLTSTDATMAASLPASVVKNAQLSNTIPINPDTSKPFELNIPQDVSANLSDRFTTLREAGIPAARALEMAKGLTLGTNATVQPDIQTNAPGIAYVPNSTILGVPIPFTGTSARPPETKTNSFSIRPGGIDQNAVAALRGNPALLQSMGLPNSGQPNPATSTSSNPYQVGATYKGGLKYLGGDPTDPNSWQQSTPAGSSGFQIQAPAPQ